MDWPGIRRDEAAAGDGTFFVVNARYYTSGELRRRNGMERFSATSGTLIDSFWAPTGERVAIFLTTTGTLETVTAT